MSKSIIAQRREVGAVCSICQSSDYAYDGRANNWPDGKHQFHCNSCNHSWQYGKGDSDYLRLTNPVEILAYKQQNSNHTDHL